MFLDHFPAFTFDTAVFLLLNTSHFDFLQSEPIPFLPSSLINLTSARYLLRRNTHFRSGESSNWLERKLQTSTGLEGHQDLFRPLLHGLHQHRRTNLQHLQQLPRCRRNLQLGHRVVRTIGKSNSPPQCNPLFV